MKKKNENVDTIKSEIKVKFINTYIGKLGNFYKDKVYVIPAMIYEMLKMDCGEV